MNALSTQIFSALLLCASAVSAVADPVVIAHRGAAGYLPEHSLAGYAMAYAQGADYLEPDIVISADGHAIALHDLTLDGVTDVRQHFSDRARDDGLHYAIDFTLAELRQLQLRMRVDPDTDAAAYPARMSPTLRLGLRIVTLSELIELTQALNQSSGRDVGIYPEIKFPSFHQREGQDITRVVHELLEQHGYSDATAKVYIQCFEPGPLIRLRDEFNSPLRRVQLLGENAWEMNEVDYEPLYSAEGLAAIAEYADAIGPPIARLFSLDAHDPAPRSSGLVQAAHQAGLKVHPYTFRADALPPGVSAPALLRLLFAVQKVDGLFTDQTDVVVGHLIARQQP